MDECWRLLQQCSSKRSFFHRGLTEIQITGSFPAHEILIVTSERSHFLLLLVVLRCSFGSAVLVLNQPSELCSTVVLAHYKTIFFSFQVLLSGLIGVVSWKRPLSLVVRNDLSFYSICCLGFFKTYNKVKIIYWL